MPSEIKSVLLRQHEIAWKLAGYHLDGLSVEECRWRPSAKGLHVITTHDGCWRGELPEHEGYDLGPPSMAWLLWHMTYWWSMVINHCFDDATLDHDSVVCPSEPDRIRATLESLHERWVGLVAILLDDDLRSRHRAKWPFKDRPLADVIAWTNIELTKNAAELGYARFLYATRDSN